MRWEQIYCLNIFPQNLWLPDFNVSVADYLNIRDIDGVLLLMQSQGKTALSFFMNVFLKKILLPFDSIVIDLIWNCSSLGMD